MLQELEVNFNVRVGSNLDKISQFKKKTFVHEGRRGLKWYFYVG